MLTQTEVYATRIAKKSYTEIMKCGRFMASLKKAPRLVDNGYAHQLPPGTSIPVYPVDALPGCPEDWVRGPGSYVCPVAPDWGLWFEWTMNDHLNTAILPSVKGMNPITGQKMDGLKLAQFKSKCPVHDVPFKGDDRFCEKCGFCWPAQDYVSSPNVLWWDGFRQPDGSVRQFFFSEDEGRDVASAVIGEKNTVPAFGFAFFEPRVRREQPRMSMMRGISYGGATKCFAAGASMGEYKGISNKTLSKKMKLCSEGPGVYEDDGVETQQLMFCSNSAVAPASAGVELAACCADLDSLEGMKEVEEKTSGGIVLHDTQKGLDDDSIQPQGLSRSILRSAVETEPRMPSENAKVAVGAGAKIKQDLRDDPLDIKEWKDEPSAVVRLYFVFRAKFERIMEKGVLDLKGSDEGYLKGVKVG